MSNENNQEVGQEITTKRALRIIVSSNSWLMNKIHTRATCSCGSCVLCAYRHFERLGKSAGNIDKPVNGEYVAACVICKEQTGVMLYPHRLDGKIVGWVFVCAKDADAIAGADVTIQKAG
jgi:hypothetical protein